MRNIVGTLLCTEDNLFVTSKGLVGTVVCQEKGPGIRLPENFNSSLFIACLVIAPLLALILASISYVRKQRKLWGYEENDEVSPLSRKEPVSSHSDFDDDDAESPKSSPSFSEPVNDTRTVYDVPEKKKKKKGGGFLGWRRNKKVDDDRLFEEEVKSKIGVELRLFSGCSDSQQAADIVDISDFQLPRENGEGGACTAAFLKTLYAKHEAPSFDASYVDILKCMRQNLESKGSPSVVLNQYAFMKMSLHFIFRLIVLIRLHPDTAVIIYASD